ncbi:phosphoglycerate mutase-like protein [Coemansia reversa NRRL 1564]|uniref:Phosphoglycerate mutase-like protein n=1 Tax=Coemansia reversa (strain ATCC 12441 / NRRL 1564) TaxID=763665 RepID=A0A2G5B8A6_COERN|nr:phosphoglycerate mutase-like protein [Coemansia reversa NRRL 1564]|eukprot:PIA15231.1 phosphoglycerate mutase-like protein [Coemansia reversa NRRL 1564]
MAVLDIYLARHGQTEANATAIMQGSRINPPLNQRGEKQANALAEAMKDEKLDWILTSGLERAIQTGNRVAKYHSNAPFVSDARLNEISWGEADGQKFSAIGSELNSVLGKWKSGDADAKIKGGESANDGRKRILLAFTDILKISRERDYHKIILCIHGRIMRVIMASLVDKDLSKMQRFSHTNGCYHHIRVDLSDDNADLDPSKLVFEPIRIDVRDHLENLKLSEHEPNLIYEL